MSAYGETVILNPVLFIPEPQHWVCQQTDHTRPQHQATPSSSQASVPRNNGHSLDSASQRLGRFYLQSNEKPPVIRRILQSPKTAETKGKIQNMRGKSKAGWDWVTVKGRS